MNGQADLRYRMAQRSDLPALCSLINDTHRSDDIPQVVELDELAEDLDDAGDLTTDVQLALFETELVGYVRTLHFPSEELLERGTAQLRTSTNALPKYLRVEAPDQVETSRRLFEHIGFREVRKFEELLRPLTDLPPLRVPAGVRIVPWPDDRDDEILTVKNLAFSDHWGSTPTPANSWNLMVRGFGSYPERSFIAVDDEDRVVAYSLNHRYSADDEVIGRRDGWIDNLGTVPDWRGRGLASALIAHSLHAFAAAGLTHASLGVDSDSLTGAARLYRSLGFERNRGHSTLEIALS